MKKTITITALIYMALGLFMIITPASVSNFICYIIGFLILVFGGNQILLFVNSKESSLSKFNLIIGILAILLGCYIVFNPETFISFIPFIAGVVIVIDAVTKLIDSFNLKKAGYSKWKTLLITSLLMLIFGLFLFFNSFGAIKIVIQIIGIFLIIDGISQLYTSNAMNEKNKIIEAKIIK